MNTEAKHGVTALALQTHFTDEEKKICDVLVANGQAHLFADWGPTGEGDTAKSALLKSIAGFDAAYPGGVAAYIPKARSLLSKSRAGNNPYEGYSVSAPRSSVRFSDDGKENKLYEDLGMGEIGRTAFILVAGGLGERLGYKGIKPELPWETVSMKSFLQHYIEHLLAYQSYARKNDSKVTIQLGIMTSGDTHELTMKLLTANNYFGVLESQVTIFQQALVPALADNDARFCVKKGVLIEKPHGHGDVHMLLYQQGIVSRWQKEHNVKWLVFFQDTNGLIFRAIPAALGVSVEQKLIMNYICSTRRQGDAVGAICTLERIQGNGDQSLPDALTINVEYNQITGLLGNQPEPEVDGFSVYPGNTNALIFDVPSYLTALAKTQGVISEFVNPKYADKAKTAFKKPTRLECMMQDFPKLLSTKDAQRVGFAQFSAWTAFSAVKNSVTAAAVKQRAGNNPECASSGEYAHYTFGFKMLQQAGVTFTGEIKTRTFAGVSIPHHAKIALSPSVGSTKEEIQSHFSLQGSDIHITNTSVLSVDGAAIDFISLALDGALLIKACDGASVTVRNLTINNDGWNWEELSEGDHPEYLRVRGFDVVKNGTTAFHFSEPGTYVLSDETKAQFLA